MTIKAKLRITLEADGILIAESENHYIWQKVLSDIMREVPFIPDDIQSKALD